MKNCFSENLKQLRTLKKLSQAKLAQLLSVTQQCVSEWELGKTEPTLSYLVKLADIFEISLDLLCGREEW